MSAGHTYGETGRCSWPGCGASVWDDVGLDLCLGFGKRPAPEFDRGHIQRYNLHYSVVMDKTESKADRDKHYDILKGMQKEYPGLREAAKMARDARAARGGR